MISARQLTSWHLDLPPRPPSDFLKEDLRRLEAFDLEATERAKTLLIDALFAEIVPTYDRLKGWKAVLLETDSLTGVADYMITTSGARRPRVPGDTPLHDEPSRNGFAAPGQIGIDIAGS